MINLYPFQKRLIADIYRKWGAGENINKVNRILAYAPTGSGKTVIASRIMKDASERGKTCWFLVHRNELIPQTMTTLINGFGLTKNDIGVISAKYPFFRRLNAKIQIVMLQSLKDWDLEKYPKPDLIINDEAHNTGYFKRFKDVVDCFAGQVWAVSDLKVLGLSATPFRTKKKEGFCHFYEAMAIAPSIAELVDLKLLRKPRLFSYPNFINEAELEVGNSGDYTQESLKIVCNDSLNDAILEEFLDKYQGLKSIFFLGNIKALHDMVAKLQDAGIPARGVTGSTPKDTRDDIYYQFKKGQIKVLCTVDVLTEGFDETSIELVVLGRPTRSRARYLQMVGRGLRKHPGLRETIILDYGLCYQLGLPTDDLKLSLCPSTPKLPTLKAIACPNCGHTFNINPFLRVVNCPECGHEIELFDDEGFSTPELFIPMGHLVEILGERDREKQAYLAANLKRFYTLEQKERESDHRLSPVRAAYLFYEKYHHFPPENWYRGLIFGGMNPGRNQILYRQYLEKVFVKFKPARKAREINKWLNREFSVSKEYSLVLPPTVGAESDCLSYLGLPHGSTPEDIRKAYIEKVEEIEEHYQAKLIDENIYRIWLDALNWVYDEKITRKIDENLNHPDLKKGMIF